MGDPRTAGPSELQKMGIVSTIKDRIESEKSSPYNLFLARANQGRIAEGRAAFEARYAAQQAKEAESKAAAKEGGRRRRTKRNRRGRKTRRRR